MRKIVDAEPELLLPYVLGRMGATQRYALTLLAAAVAAGQADGSVRTGDPEVIARGVMLAAQSFLFSGAGRDGEPAAAVLDAELERIVDAALAPG
jgi:hypothetical protein